MEEGLDAQEEIKNIVVIDKNKILIFFI